MPRFFVSKDAIGEGEIVISEPDSRHIARSLRMAVGDTVNISDGEGTDYTCTLTHIRDEECIAKIDDARASLTESPIDITLYMAMPKGDKLEYVVQKAVELGASTVVPFESERCIKRPAPDKIAKMTERLNRIALEAAKQCGRGKLPRVLPMIRLDELLARIPEYEIALFCYEDESKASIKAALSASNPPSSLAIIVGAEGGFSAGEADKIIKAGAISVTLGPRILRCETAPDYALSAVSFLYEL